MSKNYIYINDRARLDKTQKRSQNIPSRSLTSEDGSIEY